MDKPKNGNEINNVVHQAIDECGESSEALIPILSRVNREYGYIPAEAFTEIKRQLKTRGKPVIVSESQLYGMATFYDMLSTQPTGRHVIRFCESAPCHVVGGRQLLAALQDRLEIQPGETSPDGRWSLLTSSCLGVCGVGPVLVIDDDIYGGVAPEQLAGILSAYE